MRSILYIMHEANELIPYSGLFSKQKFSQERQKLNFKELNFRRLQISKNFYYTHARIQVENDTYNQPCSEKIVSDYHIYKDTLKLFQNRLIRLSRYLQRSLWPWPKGTDLDGHSLCCFEVTSIHSFISGLNRSGGQCFR